MFKNKWNPFGIIRWSGRWLSPCFLKSYINKRLWKFTKEEKLVVYKYYYTGSIEIDDIMSQIKNKY